MAKSLTSGALDSALSYIATRADLMTLCAGAPADAAEASALVSAGGKSLASMVLAEGAGGGDFSLAEGLMSGRRLIVGTQSAVPVTETGTVDHVALVDTDSGELLIVTPVTEVQPVTSGEIISVRAFGAEIADPV